MKNIITMGLLSLAALTFVSCTCPRCGGSGREFATTDGTHPYTYQKYYAGEPISCLRCGGKGDNTGGAGAARYSQQGLFRLE